MKNSSVQIAVFIFVILLGAISFFCRTRESKLISQTSLYYFDKSKLCDHYLIKKLPANRKLICGVGVDINQDSIEDLMTLPKIGTTKAHLIIEYRKKHGKFHSTQDLTRIKGIGKKTAEKVDPWLQW